MTTRPIAAGVSLTRRPTRSSIPTLVLILGAWLIPGPDGALRGQAEDEPMNMEWWHPLAAGAGVATLMLLDEPVRDLMQPRPESLDGVADFAARFKDPEVYYITSGGAFLIGLAAKKPKLAATGVQIIAAYGVAGWMNIGTKWVFGRTRPSETPGDVNNFSWFDGGEESSFSSGSAAVVFSLATTVADAVDRRPVTIVLYSGAVLNSWARLHYNKHWLSDVALGALYGVTAAKLVNGEWTVFGLRPPSLWTDGQRSGFGYTVRF